MTKERTKALEYVEPIGLRVLVRKDEPKRQTKGGIALPDQAEIPTITGRIVAISAQIENDEDVPLRQYDKILFHPKNAIPVDFEADNQLFVVPVEDVVAVFRREPKEDGGNEQPDVSQRDVEEGAWTASRDEPEQQPYQDTHEQHGSGPATHAATVA